MHPRTRRIATAALSAVPAGGALLRERRALREAAGRRSDELEEARLAALTGPLVARPIPPYTVVGPVTRALYERLVPEDLAELDARLEGDARTVWDRAPEGHRPWLAVVLSANYQLEGAMARTGLTHAHPPDEVHAMSRGPLATGGDPSTADMVVESLEEAGMEIADGATVLDFGCSSGRVLRALAAWRPDLDCLGCDPNVAAIDWAQAHLPMARFFHSSTSPPLELADGSVDVAFAISIWSHFDAASARAWLAEMHRVVAPGGTLLLTIHGLDSLGAFLREDAITRASAAEIISDMLRDGHKYYDVFFGPDGDWGVKHPGWGNAHMTLEWLARETTPHWSMRLFREGALLGNQDAVVLERRV